MNCLLSCAETLCICCLVRPNHLHILAPKENDATDKACGADWGNFPPPACHLSQPITLHLHFIIQIKKSMQRNMADIKCWFCVKLPDALWETWTTFSTMSSFVLQHGGLNWGSHIARQAVYCLSHSTSPWQQCLLHVLLYYHHHQPNVLKWSIPFLMLIIKEILITQIGDNIFKLFL